MNRLPNLLKYRLASQLGNRSENHQVNPLDSLLRTQHRGPVGNLSFSRLDSLRCSRLLVNRLIARLPDRVGDQLPPLLPKKDRLIVLQVGLPLFPQSTFQRWQRIHTILCIKIYFNRLVILGLSFLASIIKE